MASGTSNQSWSKGLDSSKGKGKVHSTTGNQGPKEGVEV
jgi:hypothetical protein